MSLLFMGGGRIVEYLRSVCCIIRIGGVDPDYLYPDRCIMLCLFDGLILFCIVDNGK
jgi:hypothetical protein